MSDPLKQQRFQNLLQRGTEALQQGDPYKAITLLERALQLNAHNWDVRLNLSSAYILSKKFKKAQALLEQLRHEDERNPMIWLNLGAAYLGNPVLATSEEQLQAISAFTKAAELEPNTPHVAYNIALIHLDRQEYHLSLSWFQQALSNNPQDKDAARYITTIEQILAQQN